jgi:hypothetical protein
MSWKKRMLRNEHRKQHRRGSDRRELGRTPLWVFQDKRDAEKREDKDDD